MAGIKISQLNPLQTITGIEEIPVSVGLETFKTGLKQFVTTGQNTQNSGGQVYFGESETSTTSLMFRALSSTDESLTITTDNDKVMFTVASQTPIKTKFFGNGTSTTFSLLSANSANPNNYRVDIDGTLQEPNVDYNINGTNIVFTTAPSLSSKVVVVSNVLRNSSDANIVPTNSYTANVSFNNNTRILSADVNLNNVFTEIANQINTPGSTISLAISSSIVPQLSSLGSQTSTSISQLSSQTNTSIIQLSSHHTTQPLVSATKTLIPGDSILADTSSGAFTINLPASPFLGARVQFADAKGTWATNNLTVGRNGSTIENLAEDLICDANNKMFTSVYNGVTWKVYLG